MSNSRKRRAGILVGSLLVCLALTTPARGTSKPEAISMTGVLSTFVEDDFERGTFRRVHYIKERQTGKMYRLELEDPAALEVGSGSLVLVRGEIEQSTFVAKGSVEVIQQAALVTGQRKALVLITDFQNSTVSCSDGSVEALMFTGSQSIDGLYQETSFGQVSFPPDTDSDGQPDVHRITISARSTDACDPIDWGNLANAEASAAGVDLGLYPHIVYVLPSNSCTWSGFANIGCTTECRAWVKTCSLPDVFAHELGHNLGMKHASTDTDNDGTVNSSYGDHSDVMGLGGLGWRQVNAPHKEQMGWIPTNQIVEITGGGTQDLEISPLEDDPGQAVHPQILKIYQADRGDYYYLSYRRRTGYDQTLNSSYADRTNIHRWPGTSVTKYIASVGDGQVFDDPAGGVTITQLSHDTGSATVRVSVSCSGSADTDGDGTPDCTDGCPADANKIDPGVCGCGTSDVDSDGDGTPDCNEPTPPPPVNGLRRTDVRPE